MVKGRGYPLHGHTMHKSPTHPNMNTQSEESWVKGAGLKGSFQAEDELQRYSVA